MRKKAGVDLKGFETRPAPYGEETRPGQCPEQQLIVRRPSMINEAREVLCQRRFSASLIYVLIVNIAEHF